MALRTKFVWICFLDGSLIAIITSSTSAFYNTFITVLTYRADCTLRCIPNLCSLTIGSIRTIYRILSIFGAVFAFRTRGWQDRSLRTNITLIAFLALVWSISWFIVTSCALLFNQCSSAVISFCTQSSSHSICWGWLYSTFNAVITWIASLC